MGQARARGTFEQRRQEATSMKIFGKRLSHQQRLTVALTLVTGAAVLTVVGVAWYLLSAVTQ